MTAWNARSTGESSPAIPAGLCSWCIGSWHTHTLTAPCLTSRTAGGSVLVSHLFLSILFYFTRNIASRLSLHSGLMLSWLYPTSLKRLAYRLGELQTACSVSHHLLCYASGQYTVFPPRCHPLGTHRSTCAVGVPPSPVPL